MVGFMVLWCSLVAAAAAAVSAAGYPTTSCSSAYLSPCIAVPSHGKVLNVAATPVTNYDLAPAGLNGTISFCNVTVTYTHPGWGDTVHINLLLPQQWNGRFQGVGGGGWATSSGPLSLVGPVAMGYAAANTDGGHAITDPISAPWAREPDGQLDFHLLEDFASVALNDLGVVGKRVTHKFYGQPPKYAYWNGCSTGGRQGLMLAQRYPTVFDGIYAGAPAVHFETLSVAQYWGQFVMNQLKHYPPSCVFDTITAAAVKACDHLDGVTDGVIAALSRCRFDPYTLVGSQANCTTKINITRLDAEVAAKTWQGPRGPDGKFLWFGLNPGAAFEGLTGTTCSGTTCTGAPFSLSPDWIATWLLNRTNEDLSFLSLQQYAALYPQAYAQYHDLIGTEDPDLAAFKARGGKIVSWHGLADQLIYPNGTIDYYQAVESRLPAIRDFYRFFPAPGVGHCGGGAGEVPTDPFGAVVDWVEKGQAPDTLPALSTDGTRARNLCQFPLVSVYKGGDPKAASSFQCQENW